MGKKQLQANISKNSSEEEDFDPKHIPKRRKNHKIGYDVRMQIVDKVILDQDDFNVTKAVNRYKTKESTIKSIKKQMLERKYITLFNSQLIRRRYELEVMQQVFERQMHIVEQNKEYILSLYKFFYQTDLPNFHDVQNLSKYSQKERKIITKYIRLYNFSTPKQNLESQNQTKEEESVIAHQNRQNSSNISI